MPLCKFLTTTSHSGPRVPAGTRSSLRPLSFEGHGDEAKLGRTSRENARACLQWTCELKQRLCHPHSVVASAAKQSRIPPRRRSGLLRHTRNDDVEAVARV